jgi:hypothetical protein
MLSEVYAAEAMKKSSVFECGINGSNRVARKWKMMKQVVVQDLTEPEKMVKNCRIWCIQIDV